MFTISGWIIFAVISIGLLIGAWFVNTESQHKARNWVATIFIIIAIFFGMRWYFTSTASGIRSLNDERSNLSNGLDRVVTIYTAQGDVIAQYEGKIDLEMDQDYVKFDWEGKRYIYYNCFVETIADLP